MPGVPTRGLIIWPLLAQLRKPLALQQRPQHMGGLRVPDKVVNRPWNKLAKLSRPDELSKFKPSVVHALMPRINAIQAPVPALERGVRGVTRGVAMGTYR